MQNVLTLKIYRQGNKIQLYPFARGLRTPLSSLAAPRRLVWGFALNQCNKSIFFLATGV
jgi:hypothetical protein